MQCLKWKSFEHTTCDFRLKLLKWNNQNVSEEKNVIVKTKLSATSREFRPGQGMMTSSSSQPPANSIALYQLLVADYSSKSHVKDVPFYPNRTCGWLVHELSTLREARALNRAVVELAWRKELPSHMRDALTAAASSKTRTGGWVMERRRDDKPQPNAEWVAKKIINPREYVRCRSNHSCVRSIFYTRSLVFTATQ